MMSNAFILCFKVELV